VITNGFQKSAQILSAATAEDRVWVLSMLATEDRSKVMAALRELHSPVNETGNSNGASLPSGAVLNAMSTDSAYAENNGLNNADSESMRVFLSTQPEWVRAILVADARWPWVKGYLASLDASQLEHLETCVRHVLASVKPRVRAVISAEVNRVLLTTTTTSSQLSEFDLLVTQLRNNRLASPTTNSTTGVLG
jgi:hypothetical protein